MTDIWRGNGSKKRIEGLKIVLWKIGELEDLLHFSTEGPPVFDEKNITTVVGVSDYGASSLINFCVTT